MEVENQAPGVEEAPEKMDLSLTEAKSPVKEDDSSRTEEGQEGSPKKNGTLAGIAAAAAANAASVAASSSYRREERVHTSGIIVQFPEMFSLKRDRHILDKFSHSLDVRMQKCAFIECESEEAAAALQAKLNGSTLNNKSCSATRLDLVERKTIYTSNLKKETTDDFIKATYPGVEDILREKYSVYLRFSSEAESRAAKTKIIKEGINGQKVHCDFDHKRDRFSRPEESAAKKPRMEEDGADYSEGAEGKTDDSTREGEADPSKEGEVEEDHTEDVKADEW